MASRFENLRPGVFVLAAVGLLTNYAVRAPMEFAVNVAVVLAGIPVYLWWRRRGDEAKG